MKKIPGRPDVIFWQEKLPFHKDPMLEFHFSKYVYSQKLETHTYLNNFEVSYHCGRDFASLIGLRLLGQLIA